MKYLTPPIVVPLILLLTIVGYGFYRQAQAGPDKGASAATQTAPVAK